MTPQINKNATRSLSVPDFSGGVNCRDGISQCHDNQLTECENVWYKNGLLQTRPGFVASAKDQFGFENYNGIKKIYSKKENFRVMDGRTYFLVVYQYEDRLYFEYCADGDKKPVKTIEKEELPTSDFTCNIFQYKDDIYCFCSGYYEGLKYGREDCPYFIFKIFPDAQSPEGYTHQRITPSMAYIPTVSFNGEPNNQATTGTLFEGYNLLSPFGEFLFSSAKSDWDEVGSAPLAHFYLPIAPTPGTKLELTYTSIKYGPCTHRVTTVSSGIASEYKTSEEVTSKDNLCLKVDGKKVYLVYRDSTKYEGAEYDYKELYGYLANNIRIIAHVGLKKEECEKVLNMTFCDWFGGGAEGIYGGIHLFMGGNTSTKDKSLVCWSDFNKPLYFSENGYAYVGDAAQSITAFGKQDKNLIVFKEREIFSTAYSSSGDVIDSETLISGTVVDVSQSEVTFPFLQVHGFIGCDCPNTVQLCRNRLVWTHSDGKVYTLVSSNGWTERAVFEVSAMIERQITDKSKLKTALSADWNDHYVLFVGEKAYLMDYNSHGYTHVYSYTKNQDSQSNIPWWIWSIPETRIKESTMVLDENGYPSPIVREYSTKTRFVSAVSIANSLFVFGISTVGCGLGGDGYVVPEVLQVVRNMDEPACYSVWSDGYDRPYSYTETTPIRSIVQTKLFDFGAPTILKSVPKTEISFGNNKAVPIMVTTITDKRETTKEVFLNFENDDERNPQFFKNVVVRNTEKRNCRIGYRFEANGSLFVDGLVIYFKQLGGAK